jgi:hypothetical protein
MKYSENYSSISAQLGMNNKLLIQNNIHFFQNIINQTTH